MGELAKNAREVVKVCVLRQLAAIAASGGALVHWRQCQWQSSQGTSSLPACQSGASIRLTHCTHIIAAIFFH